MKIEGLSAPKVAVVQLVRRYPNSDIRRLGFEFEDALRPYLDASVNYLPENPAPDSVRFALSDGKRAFVASNTSTQMTLDFAGGVPAGGLVAALKKACAAMDAANAKLLGHQEKFYSGLVVAFHLSAADGDGTSSLKSFADLILRPALVTPQLSSLEVTLGEHQGDFNVSLGLSRFAGFSRAFLAQRTGQMASIHIDPEFDEPDEGGIQLKVDINTKPRLLAPKQGDFEALRQRLESVMEKEVPKLFGAALEGIA